MDPLGNLHTVFATASLILGGLVIVRRKGDPLHRTLGHLYFSAMIGLNGTAFFIRDLFSGFGPFHVAAVASLATILAGMVPVVIRRPRGRWFETHAYFMAWSYIGLVSAAIAEITTRTLAVSFWPVVIASSATVTIIGAIVVHGDGGGRMRRALSSAGMLPFEERTIASQRTPHVHS